MARGSQAQTAPVARIVTNGDDGERLQHSIRRFCQRNEISRSQVYVEIAEGRLIAHKMGGKTVVFAEDEALWRRRMPVVVSHRGRSRKVFRGEGVGAAAELVPA